MSARSNSPPLASSTEKADYPKGDEKVALGETDVSDEHVSMREGQDVLALQDVDPALNAKMHLVNNVRAHMRQSPRFPMHLWTSSNWS